MKLINKIFLLIGLVTFTWSCDDDDLQLNQANPNGPSSDNYWVDLDRTESTIYSAYSGMLNHFLMAIHTESLRSDLAFLAFRPNPNARYLPYYGQEFHNATLEVNSKWESYYFVIFRTNQVIEALEVLESDPDIDMERWTDQMAEARFLRGLMHFYLHSVFNNGEIIIRDFVPKTTDDFNKALSTSDEVITFFREDLLYAYENLPSRSDWPSSVGAYRASSGAAATVLGTSYLYQQEYDLAADMFEIVLASGDYQLEDPYILFTQEGENGVESIFEINYSVDVRPEISQWDETSFNNRLGRYTRNNGPQGFTPAAWLIYEYAHESLNTNRSENSINGSPRPVSLRTSSMVAVVQDTVTTYYNQPWVALASTAPFAGNAPGFWKKYHTHDEPGVDSEDDTGGSNWKAGKNVVVSRLADVYLMYAEALLLAGGDVTAALSQINTVRDRWALQLLGPDQGNGDDYDGITYTATTLMEHLMYIERPLELSAEGHSIRNTDLRRWDDAGLLTVKQRYTDLAALEFYKAPFSFQGTNSNNAIEMGPAPGSEFDYNFEYDLAASNYDKASHSYLPIPVEELRNNSEID